MTNHRIWDPFVRLFHWSLVAGFAANALFVEEESALHNAIGYAVVGLVAARLVWGFLGPRYARFSNFAPTRPAILSQISDIATRRRRIHLGHTPLGAIMIFNLLGSILLIGATGYMMTTNAYWGVEWVKETHEALVIWAGISVGLHVAAVLFESLRTGVNLPLAMISGVKRVPDDASIDA